MPEKEFDTVDKNQNQLGSVNSLSEICFFCGCTAKYLEKGKSRVDVEMVKTVKFIENIRANISKRNDEWAQQVSNRIEGKDLLNAGYHKNCNINFQNNKNIPLCHGVSVSKIVGRPQNKPRNAAFSKIVELMQSEIGRIFSIKELVELMQQECDETEGIIENRYVKNKLVEHFGEKIIVISNEGKLDLLALR